MEVNFQQVQQFAEQKGIDFQTAAKQLGLTAQEAKDLEAIGGNPGKNEDGVSFSSKEKSAPEKTEKESSWWKPVAKVLKYMAVPFVGALEGLKDAYEELPEGGKNAVKVATPSIIGGVIGFILGGPGGAAVGAIAGGVLFGATSCTNINQNVGLIITADNSDEEIIAAIKELGYDLIQALYELQNKVQVGMDRIINILEGLGFQLDQIYETLLANGVKADEILNAINQNTEMQNERLDALAKGNEEIKALLVQILDAINKGNKIGANNNVVLTEIFKVIATMKGDNAQAIALLEKILAKVTEGVVQNKDMDTKTQELLNAILSKISTMDKDLQAYLGVIVDKLDSLGESSIPLLEAILKNIQNFDNNTQTLLKEILEAVLNGNEISAVNQELLQVIIEKMNMLDENTQTLLKEVLEAVLNGNEISAENQELLKVIIEKMNMLDENTQTLLKEILEAVLNGNEISAVNQELLKVIIEKMDMLGESGQAALTELLKAIKENTTVAKGTYELVKALLDKVEKLGDKADTIIEVIGKIGVGGNVDLSKIEAMLEALLEQEKANQKIFNDINSKLNLISVTLQGFAGQVDANNKAVLAKLQEILDKIPEGCKCTHETLDIKVLLEKLDKIIEEIKKDPKNEGILGDLGELENMLG